MDNDWIATVLIGMVFAVLFVLLGAVLYVAGDTFYFERKAFTATVRCEAVRGNVARRKPWSAEVFCIPNPTRHDSVTVEVSK